MKRTTLIVNSFVAICGQFLHLDVIFENGKAWGSDTKGNQYEFELKDATEI